MPIGRVKSPHPAEIAASVFLPITEKHVWNYDSITDWIEGKGQFRMPMVIDEFTCEILAIEVSRSFTAKQVIEVLLSLLPRSTLCKSYE